MLRHSPGHWKDQQGRAAYKCPEVCVYVYGRWVRFTFGRDVATIGGVAVDEKKRKTGEASASRSSIRSGGSILHAGEPRKLSTGAKCCIPTVTSPPRGISLFPVLRVTPSSIIGHWVGFSVGASRFYGLWTLGVDS